MSVSLQDFDSLVEVVEALCDVFTHDQTIAQETRNKIDHIAARARYIRRDFMIRNVDVLIKGSPWDPTR